MSLYASHFVEMIWKRARRDRKSGVHILLDRVCISALSELLVDVGVCKIKTKKIIDLSF